MMLYACQAEFICQVNKANLIFDRKDWQKTFVLMIDEYLLDFLQLSFTDHRSSNTLEKWMCRKRRFVNFFQFRYKKDDIALAQMEYKILDELKTYLLVQHKVIENTATKFIQCLKGVMERAISKGWIDVNLFAIYKCRYNTPDHDWLSMQELEILKDWKFEKEKLNIIRDIFLFGSFTGYSYQEIYSLKQSQIITDSEGNQWVSQKRQKTKSDESVPLLPLPMQILEKYKDHPVCERTGRLLPVPSNQQYNRCLKEIASKTKIDIVLRTHKSRFFFANEVTYNNGVPLKTVSRSMGHKSVKTTEVYVQANKRNISENMDMVEKKLFGESGELKNVRVINRLDKITPDNPDNNDTDKCSLM